MVISQQYAAHERIQTNANRMNKHQIWCCAAYWREFTYEHIHSQAIHKQHNKYPAKILTTTKPKLTLANLYTLMT